MPHNFSDLLSKNRPHMYFSCHRVLLNPHLKNCYPSLKESYTFFDIRFKFYIATFNYSISCPGSKLKQRRFYFTLFKMGTFNNYFFC